jgi:PPM family protein phosphatase
MEHWAGTLEVKDAARIVRRAGDERAVQEGLADVLEPAVLRAALRVRGATGAGQDRADILRVGTGYLFVVADGAGGTSGGAEAAEFLVNAIRNRAAIDSKWAAMLGETDLALAANASAGETTAVVVLITDGEVSGASVGDSGAWLVGAEQVLDLTENQSRKPLLGSGRARPVSFGPVPFRGRLVVGSDGLFKYADPQVIRSLAAQSLVEEAAEALVQATRLPGGSLQDDVTVIVVE